MQNLNLSKAVQTFGRPGNQHPPTLLLLANTRAQLSASSYLTSDQFSQLKSLLPLKLILCTALPSARVTSSVSVLCPLPHLTARPPFDGGSSPGGSHLASSSWHLPWWGLCPQEEQLLPLQTHVVVSGLPDNCVLSPEITHCAHWRNSLILCTLTLRPEILRGGKYWLDHAIHKTVGCSTPWQLIQKWVPIPTVCLVGISQFCNQRLAAKTWYLLHDVFPFRNPVVITLLLSCLHHLAKALTPLVAP